MSNKFETTVLTAKDMQILHMKTVAGCYINLVKVLGDLPIAGDPKQMLIDVVECIAGAGQLLLKKANELEKQVDEQKLGSVQGPKRLQ